jgi:hypothetical protein
VENIYIGLLVYTGGGWCLEEQVLRQTVCPFKYERNGIKRKCSCEVGYLQIYVIEKCTLLIMLQWWWCLSIGMRYKQLMTKAFEQVIHFTSEMKAFL